MAVTRNPAPADPEVAAATFKAHMYQLWASGRPPRKGWERTEVDPLTTVVRLPAQRPTGEVDHYYFKLGAAYYDAAPPTVELVEPENWTTAEPGSRWFPLVKPTPGWFGLHPKYTYRDGQRRQLLCFSFNAYYYMTNHSPKDSELWQQGRHTVSATLSRLAEVLSPPWYQRPSA